MQLKNVSVLLIVLLILGCNPQKKYIMHALNIMQEHSINSKSVNWEKVEQSALSQAKDAKSNEDLHKIVREIILLLRDNHSFLITKQGYEAIQNNEKPIPTIPSELIDNNIAYIKIPRFVGTPKMTDSFANEIQNTIKDLDSINPKGWIVDLSANTGGNMWPMLLGLGPLLNDGICGYFVDNKSKYMTWKYEEGKVYIDTIVLLQKENPYILKRKKPKIAVLIGKQTVSSGEAVAISFIGKENTMVLGVNSGGLTTGNAPFELKDGASLLLTTAIFADRNKKLYGESIKPDYATFQAKKSAVEWINE